MSAMQHQSTNKLRRVLNLDEGDHRSEVVVEIGYPKKHEEEFGCRVLIKGHTLDIENTIFGIDPMQAMTLAIRFVHCIITDNELYKSGKLYWLEPGNDFDPL